MSKIELPELPVSDFDVFDDYYDGWILSPSPVERYHMMGLFTEQSVSDYGKTCARAALERAAQIAENAHPDDWPFIAAAIRSEIERDRARLASLPKPAIQAHILVEIE